MILHQGHARLAGCRAHFSENFQRLFLWSVQFLGVPPVLMMTAVCIVGVAVAFVRQQPLANYHLLQ